MPTRAEATASDFLHHDVIEDKTFFIYDVPRPEPMVIRNKTFRRCHIHGPALITFLGKTDITGLNWGAREDQMLWEVSADRTEIVGPIALIDCTIEGGQLYSIGVAGATALIEAIRRSGDRAVPSEDVTRTP